MIYVIYYLSRIIISAILGIAFGMSVKGIILFAIVVLLIADIVGFIVAAMTGAVAAGNIVGTFIQVVAVIIILVNYSLSPNFDERYVPDTRITVSPDGKESGNIHNIKVGEPYYLQIRVKVQSNSWARNFFGKNDIPYKIEISNPAIVVFSDPPSVQLTREIQQKLSEENKTIYYYSVVAANEPKEAVIDFKVTPNRTGEQTIRIAYGDLVSDIYTRIVTLEYKE